MMQVLRNGVVCTLKAAEVAEMEAAREAAARQEQARLLAEDHPDVSGLDATVLDRMIGAGEIDLADVRARVRRAVNAVRESRLYAGPVSTGLGWSVDFRHATDRANIESRVLVALRLQMQGSADTLEFRGADDISRQLTPDEMIQVGDAVSARGSSIYAHSWVLKAAIDAAGDAGAVLAVDITEGWPDA